MAEPRLTLDDILDLREAAVIAGYGLRMMYTFAQDGTIKARQTSGGVWFTTRQEALKLKHRGKLKRGPKPKVHA